RPWSTSGPISDADRPGSRLAHWNARRRVRPRGRRRDLSAGGAFHASPRPGLDQPGSDDAEAAHELASEGAFRRETLPSFPPADAAIDRALRPHGIRSGHLLLPLRGEGDP